jgi:adenosylcobinamide amidohydrolase
MVARDASLRVLTRSCPDQSHWLVVTFEQPVRACSWAIVGGGFVDTRTVAWLEVRNADLGLHVDPRAWLLERMTVAGLEPGVGLLTSHSVADYHDATATADRVTARSIATVGLSNALRAGDPVTEAPAAGTINVLAYVDQVLSDEALIEASAIVTEAKCAAILEAGVRSRRSGRLASGTGTDCVVVASRRRGRDGAPANDALPYAGKHTAVGAALGEAVERAITAGVRRWREETGL